MKYNLKQFSQLLNGEFKCEVFQYTDSRPYHTSYSNNVNTFIKDFAGWVDFPTIDTFFRMFVDNKQDSFDMLYVSDNGELLTTFTFTNLTEE